jgi:hypothetical protein
MREKVVLGILMGMGILAMIAGIIKTVLFGKIHSADDVIYDLMSIRLWM